MKLPKVLLHVVSNALVAGTAFAAGFLFNEASDINEARKEKEAERQMVNPPPTEVALLRLEPQPYKMRLSYTGKVRAWRSATLAFGEAGIIDTFTVDRGDRVQGPSGDEPGTVLATLDKVKFEAAVGAARADLEKARWEQEKTQRLFDQGSASEEELRAVTLLCALKEAELARAEKVLRNATLRAPFSGLIAERFIEPGEAAMPSTPAFRLVEIDRVRVGVAIPGRRINEVRVGQEAHVEVETRVGETIVLTGKVHTVPPSATDQLFGVEISVDNPDGALREGMYARTVIYTDVIPSVFTLPLEAVIQVGSQRKVMVVEEDARVTDGCFDLALLPPRVRDHLVGKGMDLAGYSWHDLDRSEWNRLGLQPVEQLNARIHASRQGPPGADRLQGPGIRVFHVGDVARERILKTSRIEGDTCLVPDDGTFRSGELLIARGQHRAADGGRVVESQSNELPLPEAGQQQ